MAVLGTLCAWPALGQKDPSFGEVFGGCLVAWLPFLLILVIWLGVMYWMRRGKLGQQVTRSLEHMDRIEAHAARAEEHMERLEAQNERILAALEKSDRGRPE